MTRASPSRQGRPWRTALVAGASTRLGAAFCRALAGRQRHLVLVDRTRAALETLAAEVRAAHDVDVEVEVEVRELARPGAAHEITRFLTRAQRPADLVVVCPPTDPTAEPRPVGGTPRNVVAAQVIANVHAVQTLAHAASRALGARRRGGLLLVAPGHPFRPAPGDALDAAAGAFVTSLGQSLHGELRRSGVHVSVLAPAAAPSRAGDATSMTTVEAALAAVTRNEALCTPGGEARLRAVSGLLPPRRMTAPTVAPAEPWRTALVTGASSGIGEAAARALAARGCDLVLVARRADRLQRLAEDLVTSHGVAAEVLPADLTVTDDLVAVEERVAQGVDLLINNAGFGTSGRFANLPLTRERTELDVLVLSVARLTAAALPTMQDRGRGGILNVSSMAGFQPQPGAATYAAAKAWVTAFTRSTNRELRDTGVHLTALCPGFTDTPMISGEDGRAAPVPDSWLLSAEGVAADGLAGVAGNREVVVPGAAWRALARLSVMLPGPAVRTVMRGAAAIR